MTISSGETAIATTSSANVTLLAAAGDRDLSFLVIVNTGGTAGFWRIAAGPWNYLPTGPSAISIPIHFNNAAVEVKRIGSDDVTGLFAWAV